MSQNNDPGDKLAEQTFLLTMLAVVLYAGVVFGWILL